MRPVVCLGSGFELPAQATPTLGLATPLDRNNKSSGSRAATSTAQPWSLAPSPRFPHKLLSLASRNFLSLFLPFYPLASCFRSLTIYNSSAVTVLAASLPDLLSFLPFYPLASCLRSSTTSSAIAPQCLRVYRLCGSWKRLSGARLDQPRGASWIARLTQDFGVVTPSRRVRPKVVGACAVCANRTFSFQVLQAVAMPCQQYQGFSSDRREAPTEARPTEPVADDKRLNLLTCAASFAYRSQGLVWHAMRRAFRFF